MQQPSRIFDFIFYQQANAPLDRAFGYRSEGKWVYFSTRQVIDLANQVSCGLLELGVGEGDKVAVVVYQNRPEWIIADLGIQRIGGVVVPLYPTISQEDYEYIFNDASVCCCFTGRDDLFEKVLRAKRKTPSLKHIFTFDEQEGRPYWRHMLSEKNLPEVERISKGIQPDTLATIIYTSGTTGKPKGVMLTHHNIVSNVLSVKEVFPITYGDRALSFLPLCHVFERTASYFYTFLSIEVSFAGTDNLGGPDGDIMAVRPHFFTTVPRLLEKVYEKIFNRGLELPGMTRKIFFWALKLTEDYEYDKKYSGLEALKRKIADRLVFRKWRAALGGHLKGIVTGAAACPVRIARVFSAAGIPVREGYGLTETSPGLAIGRFEPGGSLLGTVGPPIAGVEIRIDPDGTYRPEEGEILAKGPNIMIGYYRKKEETEAVFRDIDGHRWFCTGDVGMMIKGPDGREFLKITDRKKELLKTSGGKYVAPAPLENKLKEDFLVEQVMVVGEQQKFVSALIIPASEALQDWCRKNAVEWTAPAKVFKHPKVQQHYQKIIQNINTHFGHTEQIKKFALLDANWSPVKSDGTEAELTPTLKLKRRVIMDKHAEEIEAIYRD